MTTRRAVLTPLCRGAAVELAKNSRIFRKEVLRTGTFNYQGQRLDFTPQYLDGLAKAYSEQAFDSVPLVFAGADNRHTQDIERIRGNSLGFEREGDSLFAFVQASNDDAAKVLRENPDIGVSLRIEPELERADGKRWPAAVQHVFATANPVIPGLGRWESVDLGVDDAETEFLDLSAFEFGRDDYTPEENEMSAPNGAPDQLGPEEIAAFREWLASQGGAGQAAQQAPETEYQMPSDEELIAIASGLDGWDESGEEPEYAYAGGGETGDGGSEGGEDAAELSRAFEEFRSTQDQHAIELAAAREERDQARFETLRDSLIGTGIPPHVFQIEGVPEALTGSRSIELSNGGNLDVGATMLRVIKAMNDHAQTLDLSRPGDVLYQGGPAVEDNGQRDQDALSYAREFGLLGSA